MKDRSAVRRNATGGQWIAKIPCPPHPRSPRAALLLPEAAQFHFGGHEGEAGPSTALHGPFE